MKIESIQMQSSMAQLEQADLNKEQIESARATVEQIADIMAGYRTAVSHIAADARLSKEGKQTDLAEAATGADNRLAQIVNPRLESLDKRIPELEFQTRPQAPDSDLVLEEMQQQEVRRMLASHPDYSDELQLIAHYQALALDGTNDLVMRAVEQSPIPLINNPAILEDGMKARGARGNADAARTLKQLKAVRAAIKDAADTARAELNRPDDTLVTLAETGGL